MSENKFAVSTAISILLIVLKGSPRSTLAEILPTAKLVLKTDVLGQGTTIYSINQKTYL